MRMDKNRKIELMGIVNLTPDSFYSPSRHLGDISRMIDTCGRMLDEGADILDIGAFSSRPGAAPVSAEEQLRRLSRPLEELRKAFPEATLSIDTTSAEVVRAVFSIAGPFIVNDISAGAADSQMLPTVGRLSLPYIAMHMKGTPETMSQHAVYGDMLAEIRDYFEKFSVAASEAGIKEWVMDPGFGFAKTKEQNLFLLDHLDEILVPGRRTLVGISRKSMLGPDPEKALQATRMANLKALRGGADILRVHDVAAAADSVRIYRESPEG